MGLVRLNRDPSRRQLNQFGFIWLGFVAVFALVAWLKFSSTTAAFALLIAAAVVPAIGWIFPTFMRWVFVGMSMAAWPIGFVVSHLVLALVYYLVVTPIGLIMRLFGYDPMSRRSQERGLTRWLERDGERDPESYFRQF